MRPFRNLPQNVVLDPKGGPQPNRWNYTYMYKRITCVYMYIYIYTYTCIEVDMDVSIERQTQRERERERERKRESAGRPLSQESWQANGGLSIASPQLLHRIPESWTRSEFEAIGAADRLAPPYYSGSYTDPAK